jgi:transposase
MMGTLPAETEQPLFSYCVQLERRIHAGHPLRRLRKVLDLSFVAPAVQHCYGKSGNVSVDPQVIMKMMLLLFYYNIPSERELMEQIPERLDFLWFLGYDLESVIPNHSVLSKARSRWGSEVFEKLFVRTIEQCAEAGLVDGRLLHIDSTTLKANASRNSVIESSPELVAALRQAYQEQAGKLELLDPPVSEAKVESSSPTPELPAVTPPAQPAAPAARASGREEAIEKAKNASQPHACQPDGSAGAPGSLQKRRY